MMRRQTAAQLAAGMVLGVRGLLGKELRSRSRGWRPMLLLTGYLGVLAAAVAGFLAVVTRAGGTLSPTIGTLLFSALAFAAVLLLAFITPALTVGAVSGERERRTLDLLLVTQASALGLVSGKLLGSLTYSLFLLVASLPAFALVYLFGGVPPQYVAMVLAVAAVTALAHASLGLLLSALLRRTIVASVVAYLVVLVLVLGLPFASVVTTVAAATGSQGKYPGGPQPAGLPPAYVYASPITALASVLPSGFPGGSPGPEMLRMVLASGPYGPGPVPAQPATIGLARSVYAVGRDPITGQVETITVWAPWVYYFLFSGALTLLSLLGASLALGPGRRWRR